MTDFKKMRFEGIDVCNEISLCEYGMLLAKKDDEYYIIFGCSTDDCGNYIGFEWGVFVEEDLDNIIVDQCNDSVLSYMGSTMEEWSKLSLFKRIFDLYDYYGAQTFSHYDQHNLLDINDLHKKFNLGF